MQDDIIKKVFETVYIQVQSEITDLEKSINQKYDNLKAREQAITEVTAYTAESLRKILTVAASLDNDKKATMLESGLNSLIVKLKEITQTTHDETLRLAGASNTLASVVSIIGKGYALHEQELERAHSIQEKQDSGLLDQKRKLGSRSEKLKDVRNYSSSDKKE